MTKQDIMDQICEILGVRRFEVSTGSSEPRDFFVAIAIQLGFGEDSGHATKPELAKLIIESLGGKWAGAYESTGSTITTTYFKDLLELVKTTFQ